MIYAVIKSMVLEHQVICANYNHNYTSVSALSLCYKALQSLKEIPWDTSADKISLSDLDDFVNKAKAPVFFPLCSFIQLEFWHFEWRNVNNMVCALLLVAKYDRSENHSLYFMVVQKSLISLLVKGINESLKALLSPHH